MAPIRADPPLHKRLAYEGDDCDKRNPICQGTNLNERDLTLDLTSECGLDIAPAAGREGRRAREELFAAGTRLRARRVIGERLLDA